MLVVVNVQAPGYRALAAEQVTDGAKTRRRRSDVPPLARMSLTDFGRTARRTSLAIDVAAITRQWRWANSGGIRCICRPASRS